MSWLNDEIDQLFRDLDDQQTFHYKDSYFREIETYLPLEKQKQHGLFTMLISFFLILIPISISHMFIIDSHAIKYNISTNHSPSDNELNTFRLTNSQKTYQFLNRTTELNAEENHYLLNSSENDGINIDSIVVKSDPESIDLATISAKHLEHLPTRGLKNQYVELNKEYHPKKTGFGQKSLNGFIRCYVAMGEAWTKGEHGNVNAHTGVEVGMSKNVGSWRLNYGLGIEITRFSNLAIMERTKIYGLSSQILENSYSFQSMFSSSAPISVDYVKGRHLLGFGLTTKVHLLSTVHHRKSLDGNSISFSTGYTGVGLFQRIQLQPQFRYAYAINENLTIGLNAGLSLFSPIRSDRLEGEHVHHPISIELSVQKEIQWK